MNSNIGQSDELLFDESNRELDSDSQTFMMDFFNKIIIKNKKIKDRVIEIEKYVEGIYQYLIMHCYELIHRIDGQFSILFEVKEQLIQSRPSLIKHTLLLEILVLYDLKLYKKRGRILGFRIFREVKEKLLEQGLFLTQKSQSTIEYYCVFINTLKGVIKDSNNKYSDTLLSVYYKNRFDTFAENFNIIIPAKFLEKEFEYKLLKLMKPFAETLFIDEAIANYQEILDDNEEENNNYNYNLFKNRTEIILHGLKDWISKGNTFNIKTPSNIAWSLIYLVEKLSGYSFSKKSFSGSRGKNIYKFLKENERILNNLLEKVLVREYDRFN